MQKYFQKGWEGESALEFPLVADGIPEGGNHSRIVSPRAGDPHGLESPLYPGDPGFSDLSAEVVEVRMQVLKGRWPSDFMKKYHPRADFNPDRIPEPLRSRIGVDLDPRQAAGSAIGDHPLQVPINIHSWLLEQKPEPRTNVDTGHDMFLENMFYVPENMADRAKRLAIKAVESKYWFGLLRPEEALNMQGHILTPSIFGCPCHPSYPALHATAASASGKLDEEYFLKREWVREIFDSVFHHSFYRTFGAFHYGPDNKAGMKLGGMWTDYWIN